jgi:glutamine synthetase
LVFPDQFGRLTGLKLNAEYFIEVVEASKKDNSTPCFEFKYNPFRYDVLGKMITFPDNLPLPKSMRLTPDLDTLREQPWISKEAVVMATVLPPDSEQPLSYAPRNILKKVLFER